MVIRLAMAGTMVEANSAQPTESTATPEVLLSQSVHPTISPPKSPKARRAYT